MKSELQGAVMVPVAPPERSEVSLNPCATRRLLARLGRSGVARPGTDEALVQRIDSSPAPIEDQVSAALGCKTPVVATTLLTQIVRLEHPSLTTVPPGDRERAFEGATAMLAELEPATATEALLAAQMVGTQRLAMDFLSRAIGPGQTGPGADANVLRATRLMRMFTEQVETMSRLKGRTGQQRVVVEHVTVESGGRAIVGAVLPGGGRRER